MKPIFKGLKKGEDEKYMRMALGEAEEALRKDEVPIGAVLVVKGEVLASAHNLRETLGDPTAHAELLVIKAAASKLKDWRVEKSTLYVTVEPCIMCVGTMLLARIERLVYGCKDKKAGAAGSMYDIPKDKRLSHKISVTSGILADDCEDMIKHFFHQLRRRG